MPEPLAKALAYQPEPIKDRDTHLFEHEGQAIVVKQLGDGWQATVTGPLAVLFGGTPKRVVLRADTLEAAAERARGWIDTRSQYNKAALGQTLEGFAFK